MKFNLIGGYAVSALLIASPLSIASAADMPLKAPPAPPVAAPSWSGWYVGLNAGYGWNSDSVNVVGTPLFANPLALAGTVPSLAAAVASTTGSFSEHSKGFIGGGQIGYNKQFNQFVVGLETDIQGASIRGSSTVAGPTVGLVGFAGNSAQTTLSLSNKLNYLGTLRGDLGVTVTPTVLVYGTGGLAYGGVNSNTTVAQALVGPATGTVNVPYGTSAGFSGTRAGWTAGAGLAWMLPANWSAKVEYLYYDLGNVSYGGTMSNIVAPPGGAVPTGATFYTLGVGSSTRFNGNIVRVGLNYKFSN
jgi:outer membrane immunogenic protein